MFTHQVTSKYSNYNLDVISISNIIKALSKHIIDFIYDLYHITICIICKYLEIKLSKPMWIYLHEMSWSNMSRGIRLREQKSTPWIPWTEARALLRVATGERTAQLAPMEFHLPALNKRSPRKLLEKNGGNTYVKYINLLLPCSHWLTLLSFLADHLTSSGIWLSFSCLPQLQLALLPEYLQRC